MRVLWTGIEQLVSETLVISHTQKMEPIFAESAFRGTSAKQDHAVQTLLLDGTHEALRGLQFADFGGIGTTSTSFSASNRRCGHCHDSTILILHAQTVEVRRRAS